TNSEDKVLMQKLKDLHERSRFRFLGRRREACLVTASIRPFITLKESAICLLAPHDPFSTDGTQTPLGQILRRTQQQSARSLHPPRAEKIFQKAHLSFPPKPETGRRRSAGRAFPVN